ncbi:GNAT family N-acetyltransferase [Microbispora sp. RL4-1S]|uniref:GNAT family N-acetyltransferase n=1 Tax=Microbispora oryzae TaxID=2806554 RepID=A0A940WHL5_9ACTN|nr:GNAT family protein [Microbispora oryzae]MBP2702888.1 GNAT family N-acetyltransferase [Microbispora oryzae]
MFDERLTIITERLVLRPFGKGDAGRVRAVIAAGAQPTALPPGSPGHPAGIGQWLSNGVHELWRSGQGIHLAMETADGIIGSISLFKAQWGMGIAEVGYGVHPAHRGRGYATEAVRGLTARLLGEGVLRRVELRANADNVASIRVAEKAGFVREGLLRGAGFEDDGPHDLVVFGLLKDDTGGGERRRLESDRLILRPYARRDAFDIVDAVRDDPEIARWMTWAEGYTLERALEWVTRLAHNVGPGYGGNFAIQPRDGGRLAGAIGVQREDHERGDAELGYWIAPWARRQGYAAEATRMVTAYLFGMGFHRVHLLVARGNLASQAVARRAGFIEEGILRQALPVPGGRADAILFGILNGEISWQ